MDLCRYGFFAALLLSMASFGASKVTGITVDIETCSGKFETVSYEKINFLFFHGVRSPLGLQNKTAQEPLCVEFFEALKNFTSLMQQTDPSLVLSCDAGNLTLCDKTRVPSCILGSLMLMLLFQPHLRHRLGLSPSQAFGWVCLLQYDLAWRDQTCVRIRYRPL
jgi:hypothetical protein